MKTPAYKLTQPQAEAILRLRSNSDFSTFLELLASTNEEKLKLLVLAPTHSETLRGQVQALTGVLDTVIDAPEQLKQLTQRKE